MKIRYTPRAWDDIESIYQHLHKRSPSGALNVFHAIKTSVAFISEQPLASVETDRPRVRVRTVSRYRYKIFYRIARDAVEIIHVRHTSRREWV